VPGKVLAVTGYGRWMGSGRVSQSRWGPTLKTRCRRTQINEGWFLRQGQPGTCPSEWPGKPGRYVQYSTGTASGLSGLHCAPFCMVAYQFNLLLQLSRRNQAIIVMIFNQLIRSLQILMKEKGTVISIGLHNR